MILAFLLGLVAVAAIVAVVTIELMCGKWLKDYIKKKHKEKKDHDIIIALGHTRDIVDDYLRNKSDTADGVSMDDLERMCEDMPFVMADVDENGEISNYEGFKAKEVDPNFMARMKQHNGMILVEA